MRKIQFGSSMLLFLTACIWGLAFVAQSVGMDYMGPFTFSFSRFFLGGFVLLPILLVKRKKDSATQNFAPSVGIWNKKKGTQESVSFKIVLKGGICCGFVLCVATLFQQIGIQYTTVGKAGFITTLYIVIVPILGLFLHKKVQGKVWIAAVAAVFGLYMLCINENFSIMRGDIFVFISAILFSIHILSIDFFSPKMDGVILSCIQFFVAGIISIIGAFIFENPTWDQLISGAVPILYAGIMSSGVAYTLQIIGQKNLDPTIASLILSVESVVSVLAGWVILGEALTLKELFGCLLVFAAVIFVQLPEKNLLHIIKIKSTYFKSTYFKNKKY